MDVRLSRTALVSLVCGLAVAILAALAARWGDDPTVPMPAEPLPAATTTDKPAATGAHRPRRDPDTPASQPVSVPCPPPYAQLGIVRTGRDASGRPTWWHPDGSKTVLVTQTIRRGGAVYRVPAAVHATPRRVHRDDTGSR